jgi:hypothetical protein
LKPPGANSSPSRLYLEKPNRKNRAGGLALVVECLPRKLKTLISNPSTEGKKKKNPLKTNTKKPKTCSKATMVNDLG